MPETREPESTWDWVVVQVRDVEPVYAVTAVVLGLLAAILTFFLARSTPEEAVTRGGGRPSRSAGPVIGDLESSSGPSRVPPAPPASAPVEEDVPWKPRKPKQGSEI
jgi:hypothetical protein